MDIIEKFKHHPSIISINNAKTNNLFFDFSDVSYADTYHAILNLDSSKKTSGDIPANILKAPIKEVSLFITNIFNNSLESA